MLKSLTFIELGDNALTGTIPTTIGRLARLYSLGLSTNHFSGSIPASIGQLSELVFLSLYSNKLVGSIPGSLSGLTRLTTLLLSHNSFTGTIPDLSLLTNLQEIAIADLEVAGAREAFETLLGLPNLEILEFYQMQLSGTLPTSIGLLTNLQSLRLYSNSLTGTISTELGLAVDLEYLNLAENDLSGTIPSELGRLTSVSDEPLLSTWPDGFFNFDGNPRLTGSVPAEVCALQRIRGPQFVIRIDCTIQCSCNCTYAYGESCPL